MPTNALDRILTILNNGSVPCVYTSPTGLCPGTAPLSKREHYLPRALGNFKNDERLRGRICDDCQKRFSKFEDVLMHNSPEAFFRAMVGRVGRKRHKKKNIFYEPTFGISPLTVKAKLPNDEFELLWEVVAEFQMQPIKQIVLRDSSKKSLQIPFTPGMLTPEKIHAQVKGEGLGYIDTVMYMSHDRADLEEMENLCADFAKSGKTVEKGLPQVNDQVEGQMLAAISTPYLQAIAKIGFHYVLQYFNRYTGFEREFDGIKRFIYSGEGNPRAFVQTTSEQFILEFRRGLHLRFWAHLLTAQSDYQTIESRIQFFAGPKVLPLVWRILIGRDPARIDYRELKGNMFRYYDRVIDGYEGERIELTANAKIFY